MSIIRLLQEMGAEFYKHGFDGPLAVTLSESDHWKLMAEVSRMIPDNVIFQSITGEDLTIACPNGLLTITKKQETPK